MQFNKAIVKAVAVLALLCGSAFGTTILTLDPVGGAISGYAGQTDLGWGFTFFNDTDYALITSAEYLSGTTLGVFTDYISAYQFIIAGPAPESATLSQTFDSTLFTGVGQFVIDAAAPAGAHSDGQIRITYDLYSLSPNDPNFDPGNNLISSGNELTTLASVDVVAAPDFATPEPGSVWLLVAASLFAVAMPRRLKMNRPAN